MKGRWGERGEGYLRRVLWVAEFLFINTMTHKASLGRGLVFVVLADALEQIEIHPFFQESYMLQRGEKKLVVVV